MADNLELTVMHISLLCFLHQGSSGDEREMAKQLATTLCDGLQETVVESQEPTEFWELLGGKAPYASEKRWLYTQASTLLPHCI